MLSLCLPAFAQDASKDTVPNWPERYKTKNGAEVILFQPQSESWLDFQNIHARAAVAYKPARSIIAFLDDPLIVHKILKHLGLEG